MKFTEKEIEALSVFCEIMAQREGEDVIGIFMKTGIFRITEVAALSEKLHLTKEQKQSHKLYR